MRTTFALFLKFYGKEYDEIKHIPISRFWGYLDYMVEHNKQLSQTPEEAKAEKVKEADWDDEVKELKRKQENG